MMIVWDELKRRANIEKHGLDFADLTLDFYAAATIFPGKAGRYIAVGRLPNGAVTVVFARLGAEGISIISMRPASAKERRLL
jgi:uncharacterized protein